MSDSASTPKPGDRRDPRGGDRGAGAPVGAPQRLRPCRGPARRSWRWRSESSTLNSVEIAITSAPSVTDIGFSGTRTANRISADQPVASTIGTSGTSARRTIAAEGERAARARPPTRPASSVSRRRQRRGDLRRPTGPRAPAARRGCALHARRAGAGSSASLRSAAAAAARLIRRMPNASVADAAVGRDHVLGEVRRDRREQRRSTCAWRQLGRLWPAPACRRLRRSASWNRSGSEKAGHSRACPQPRRRAVAEALEHRALVGAHPFDRRRAWSAFLPELTIRSISPAHAGRALERVEACAARRGSAGTSLAMSVSHLRLRVEPPAERARARGRRPARARGGARRSTSASARDERA